MVTLQPVQVAKRVIEAEGYLELGLPRLAAERLSDVEPTSDVAAWVDCLRCLALLAVDGQPISTEPYRRKFAREMTDCYRRAGWHPNEKSKATSGSR
jgi:hypothetical protein